MSKLFHFLLASSYFIVTIFSADSSNTTSSLICHSTSSSSCGNGVSIRYPFWRSDAAAEHCGYPDFGLRCSDDGQPILTLPGDSYYVKDVNYDEYTITLVDIDVVNQTCPRARKNVTIGTLPLVYSPLDLNLSFYFNCSSSPSASVVAPIGCFKSSQIEKQSYVFVKGNESGGYEWSVYCEEKVVVTVKEDQMERGELISGFGKAMNEGFVLNWERTSYCFDCEDSDGYCGYNETSKQLLCVCKDGSVALGSNPCKKDHPLNWKRKVALGVVAALVGALSIGIAFCVYMGRKKNPCAILHQKYWNMKSNGQVIEAFIRNHGALALRRYKFSDVKKMTNSFKVKLGQGGFGAVYKGKLITGSPVAVKILNASKGNGQEFINEVASISRTSHVNVVALLGFCFEGRKKALIYEFMANGSLEKFIYKKTDDGACLSWENLYQIAIGIARGLEYLHRGCSTRIFHFDIKPHNILLDENFCPKISDFGLAKLCVTRESIISMSDARGTLGYIAPEVWNRNFGGVSHKSDVYSYGMMLLEMVGGRKNINAEASQISEIYFPDWIYKKLELGLGVDGVKSSEENNIAKRMTLVGLWCIQTIPSHRPTMSRVIEMLEGSLDSLEMPPKPVLCSPTRSTPESSTT